ncbi:MAG: SBBP repeat-containing protein [Bacteroidota bacterium]|nr:SBBP repeat-containing protein [Bacteroidota bacterium]
MKNLIAILSIFISISAGYNSSNGQVGPEWIERYSTPGNNTDAPNSIAVDNAGNVYVTGYCNSIGTGEDYATIKYNSIGDSLWVRRYNGPGNNNDRATALAVDNSGNVYVTGYSIGNGTGNDYATIKYNTNGDSLWVKRYNGIGNGEDKALALTIDGLGNVYVTGTALFSSTYFDYATIKYNSNGDSLWVSEYNGPGNHYDVPTSIVIDGSGNVYVTGYSYGNLTYEDYATVKYNSNGTLQWVKRYDAGSDFDRANSIAVDLSGNVYVTGYGYFGSETRNDYITIKYNSNGDSLWVRRYNNSADARDIATSIAVDGSENVYVTGYSYSAGFYDFSTIKYNSSGVRLWVKNYNGASPYPLILKLDSSGNVYITGSSTGNGTAIDYTTIKYDSNGDSLWVQKYDGPGNLQDVPTSMAVDSSGNVYITGYGIGNGTGEDYSTIKYSKLARSLHLTSLIEGFYNNITNKIIKDTVSVYLRNSTVPYAIVDLAKKIIDSAGNGTFKFFNATNSVPYYIVIKHRNSIETWSSGVNSFSLNNLTYNFTTAASKAYGSNQSQIDLFPIRFAIYSGDVNQDGIIDLSDLSLIDNDAFNFVSGYVKADVNGDNFVDLSDLTLGDNNAYNFVRLLRP